MLRNWSGTVFAYSMIEVMVYFNFIITMLTLLVKARFRPIGIDNSEAFEETYMSYMVNRIIKKIID